MWRTWCQSSSVLVCLRAADYIRSQINLFAKLAEYKIWLVLVQSKYGTKTWTAFQRISVETSMEQTTISVIHFCSTCTNLGPLPVFAKAYSKDSSKSDGSLISQPQACAMHETQTLLDFGWLWFPPSDMRKKEDLWNREWQSLNTMLTMIDGGGEMLA